MVEDQAITPLVILEEGAICDVGIVCQRRMVAIIVIRPEVGFRCFHIACVWYTMTPNMFEATQCGCVHFADQVSQE